MFFLEGASRELLLPFKVNPHQLKSFRLEILNTFLFLSFFFEKWNENKLYFMQKVYVEFLYTFPVY